jgi:hypothetical protein
MEPSVSFLQRANDRLLIAHQILAELQLVERWAAFGDPILVGAAAYGLVVAPDIDLEIYCTEPRIEDGFEVLRACALHSRVQKARFSNRMNGPDMGYYWQLRYQHENGQEWKIDMWSMQNDHPGSTSAALVEPMLQVLTEETRRIILEIKENLLLDPTNQCRSIHVYRAVLDEGIRDPESLKSWIKHHPTTGLMDWKPGMK